MDTYNCIVVNNFKKIDTDAEMQVYSLILGIISELEQIMNKEDDRKLRSLIGYVISEVHQIRRNYEVNLKIMENKNGKSKCVGSL
jgi:beta-galactosidase GanA